MTVCSQDDVGFRIVHDGTGRERLIRPRTGFPTGASVERRFILDPPILEFGAEFGIETVSRLSS